MLKRVIMGASALVLLAGVALAAQDDPNVVRPLPQADAQVADNGAPPPPPPGADQGQGGGWFQGWMGHGHRGHRFEGQDDRGGPGGPGGPGPMGAMMMHGKGFNMHLGPGIDVAVMCGQEPMKDCIASAQTLIDTAKAQAAAQPAAPAAAQPAAPAAKAP